MRKTLLMAAATLAAGVISSQAGVYSQNIVGYVNQPLIVGYNSIANPLDNGVNSATNLFDCVSGANDGNILVTWAGTHFANTVFDSTKTTGFTDIGTGTQTLPAPVLTPGQGFFFNNQNSAATNTFVGTVHVDAAATGSLVVGSTTNIISSATTYVYIASKLPVGGGISSVLGITNSAGALDGCVVVIPNIVAGAVHGYQNIVFDSSKSTGFTDIGTGTQTLPEPIIPVGGGFLFSNQTGADVAWVQSL